MRAMLKAVTLAAGLILPGAALAATSAVVTTDLNVRTGPSASYQRYGTIPAGDQVTVYGCLAGYNWCDVDWAGGRGWVSGNYLAYLGQRYYREPISTVGVSIGVPVLGFDPYVYHRRHYAGRSWYHERYLDRRDEGPRRFDDRGDRGHDGPRFRDHRGRDRGDDRPDFRADRRGDGRGPEARNLGGFDRATSREEQRYREPDDRRGRPWRRPE